MNMPDQEFQDLLNELRDLTIQNKKHLDTIAKLDKELDETERFLRTIIKRSKDFGKLYSWQTMDTVPKDCWILLNDIIEEHPAIVAKYMMTSNGSDHFRWAKVDGTYMTVTSRDVSHWMHLPKKAELSND